MDDAQWGMATLWHSFASSQTMTSFEGIVREQIGLQGHVFSVCSLAEWATPHSRPAHSFNLINGALSYTEAFYFGVTKCITPLLYGFVFYGS